MYPDPVSDETLWEPIPGWSNKYFWDAGPAFNLFAITDIDLVLLTMFHGLDNKKTCKQWLYVIRIW